MTFYFLSGRLIVKTNKHLYYCDYVTVIHLIPLYHDWSTENRILYHQSYHLIEKSTITF